MNKKIWYKSLFKFQALNPRSLFPKMFMHPSLEKMLLLPQFLALKFRITSLCDLFHNPCKYLVTYHHYFVLYKLLNSADIKVDPISDLFHHHNILIAYNFWTHKVWFRKKISIYSTLKNRLKFFKCYSIRSFAVVKYM